MNNLQSFKDQMSRLAFGMTVAEAQAQQVCIQCKEPIKIRENIRTKIEADEYAISAMCGPCFDQLKELEDE